MYTDTVDPIRAKPCADSESDSESDSGAFRDSRPRVQSSWVLLMVAMGGLGVFALAKMLV